MSGYFFWQKVMEFYSDFHIVGKVVFFGRWRFVKKRKKGKKSE